MERLGIRTGLDLKAQTIDFLETQFGKAGRYFYWIARGIDHRSVKPDRVRKSIGTENTFFEDLWTFEALSEALAPIIDKVWRHCESHGTGARTVTLKVKYSDFQVVSRSRSAVASLSGRSQLETVAFNLLRPLTPPPKGIRLLGVSLSSLCNQGDLSPQIALSLD
jgi:DNA polymerase-4